MRKHKKILVWSLLLIFSYTSIFPAYAWAGDIYKPFRLLVQPFKAKHREEPATCKVPAIEQLANQIDWLEHYIDDYGTIVAKHPDVWGESRLTRHRDDYERIMSDELGKFKSTMNAALRRSDQSFLGMAMALQGATGYQRGLFNGRKPTETPKADATSVLNLVNDPNITRGELFVSPTAEASTFKFKDGTISLEPTIHLNQMSRYIQHLNHLRRINEGDDTADSPGYALNLVRIPVSVLTGKKTRTGYGAEITITAEPYLTDSLLPITFRNMVVNDLVDQLSLPLVKLVEKLPEIDRQFEQYYRDEIAIESATEVMNRRTHSLSEKSLPTSNTPNATTKTSVEALSEADSEKLKNAQDVIDNIINTKATLSPVQSKVFSAVPFTQGLQSYNQVIEETQESIKGNKRVKTSSDVIQKAKESVSNSLTNILDLTLERTIISIMQTAVMNTRARVAPNPLPPTQTTKVFGMNELILMTREIKSLRGHTVATNQNSDCILHKVNFEQSLKQNLQNVICPSSPTNPTSYIHLHDARQFIQAEMNAAYDLLKAFDNGYWTIPFINGLAKDIRANNMEKVKKRRRCFYVKLHERQGHPQGKRIDKANGPIEAFAWAIIVESALLNKRLIRDINEAAGAKGCCCMAAEDMKFYLAEPTPRQRTEVMQSAVLLDWKEQCPQETKETRRKRITSERHVSFVTQEDPPVLLQPNQSATLFTEPIVAGEEICLEMESTLAGQNPCCSQHGFCDPICEFDRATRVFQEYVKCRWPIRVFALDPVSQEQNVADAYARRRELQIAMSLAFASGQINGQSLMRFARRLEWDMATIDLNRTAIAFSHGNDTFGWRFQPRFQTPPVKGNLATLGESIFGGPTRDQDLKERQLEPGMRECTAIVVMPSFVPYATFDVRTNWYKLTNPKCTELSMRETMRLSRAIQAMKNSAASCSQCAHLYRDGEVKRLFRRVNQLDKELPLQSMMVQIPHENTLGGFEMFNRGITDLAPEIIGWYGAAGINPHKSTKLFLVGDGFSVLGNKVIAGGQTVEFKLISRQVMEVTIPAKVQTYCNEKNPGVDIYMATPYGVSRRLVIPIDKNATKPKTTTAPTISWTPKEDITFWFTKAGDPVKQTLLSYYGIPSKKLSLRAENVLLPKTPITVRLDFLNEIKVKGKDKPKEIYLGSVSADFKFDQKGTYYLEGEGLATLIGGKTGLLFLLQKYLAYLDAKGENSLPGKLVIKGEVISVCQPVSIQKNLLVKLTPANTKTK